MAPTNVICKAGSGPDLCLTLCHLSRSERRAESHAQAGNDILWKRAKGNIAITGYLISRKMACEYSVLRTRWKPLRLKPSDGVNAETPGLG